LSEHHRSLTEQRKTTKNEQNEGTSKRRVRGPNLSEALSCSWPSANIGSVSLRPHLVERRVKEEKKDQQEKTKEEDRHHHH
jgi:hypothetical protein